MCSHAHTHAAHCRRVVTCFCSHHLRVKTAGSSSSDALFQEKPPELTNERSRNILASEEIPIYSKCSWLWRLFDLEGTAVCWVVHQWLQLNGKWVYFLYFYIILLTLCSCRTVTVVIIFLTTWWTAVSHVRLKRWSNVTLFCMHHCKQVLDSPHPANLTFLERIDSTSEGEPSVVSAWTTCI